MSRFVKIKRRKNNPIGGSFHHCNVWLNIGNILYIEQFADAYRIKMIGKEEFIIDQENYNIIIKEIEYVHQHNTGIAE